VNDEQLLQFEMRKKQIAKPAHYVWKRGALKLSQSADGGTIKVEVNRNGLHDTWTWAPSPERFAPPTLHGEREGKGALVDVGQKDVPPKP
jgi:hypothetical protein